MNNETQILKAIVDEVNGAGISEETVYAAEVLLQAKPKMNLGLVEYPFPLREGRLCYLRLPPNLIEIEAKRLTAFLFTLIVPSEMQSDTAGDRQSG